MIKNGTKVMILGGCVNPDNVGKVGVVVNVFTEGGTDFDGPDHETWGIDVVVEGGDPNNMNDNESLYEIHNDFIEVI